MDNNTDWVEDEITDRKYELPIKQLMSWWRQQAEEEATRTVPKAIEYGQQSLINLGARLARLAGRRPEEMDQAQLMELAVWDYINGKIERWNDAVQAGQQVSDDTLFDIAVYVKMAQYMRANGTWIGDRAQTPTSSQANGQTHRPADPTPLQEAPTATQAHVKARVKPVAMSPDGAIHLGRV